MAKYQKSYSVEKQMWFDSIDFPALELGGVAIPAPVIPFVVTLVFLISRKHIHHAQQRMFPVRISSFAVLYHQCALTEFSPRSTR